LVQPKSQAGRRKALSEFLGHANMATTLDRYGHLLPRSLDESAALLDAYIARNGAQNARIADTQNDLTGARA
jgi:hypothetical protein